jgi:D-alanyl-D-alanine dipeptidase
MSRWHHGLLVLALTALSPSTALAREIVPAVPSEALQLVVVVTKTWNASAATLLRFERAAPGGDWLAAGPARRAAVGRNGLAWGRGLQPDEMEGAEKHDGDGSTPAGAFRLSRAFGATARKPDLAYTQTRPGLVCVTDETNARYNQLADLGKEPRSWSTDESLLAADQSYDAAVIVDQNPPPSAPGRGACIFIHGWKGGTGKPTNGGVAVDREVVGSLVDWLDPEAKPVMVILPWDEYRLYQRPWGLPALQPP